jgi:iron complex transport system substrate-binding protein
MFHEDLKSAYTKETMRIVSLEPAVTDTISFIGRGELLVGVTHQCSLKDISPLVLTKTATKRATGAEALVRLVSGLTDEELDLEALVALKPTIVFVGPHRTKDGSFLRWAEGELAARIGGPVSIREFEPRTLETMYSAFEEVGTLLGRPREGLELTHRVKAQLMDWGDNFYDRSRNKRVSVVSSVHPLRIAARWIPDVIRCMSGIPQAFAAGEDDLEVGLDELERFRSDVIIVAPEGYTLEESIKTLKLLERNPAWERIPAVKRGEVVFADGISLYRPGPKFLQGAGIVVSAMAGLSSGYITKKDEFYQLRFLELHRHKFFT